MNKCKHPEGIAIKPDGIHELDPCIYETMEIHDNVRIEVRKCKHCGNVDVVWFRKEETESEILGEI